MTEVIPEIGKIEVLKPEEEIARLLDQLVREKGYDYVYPHSSDGDNQIGDCKYVEAKDDSISLIGWSVEEERVLTAEEVKNQIAPSCILGHLLYKVGYPIENFVLSGDNESGWGEIAINLSGDFAALLTGNEKIDTALTNLQRAQDTGTAWGPAVDKFKEEVGLA